MGRDLSGWWRWPDGLAWRWAHRVGERLRRNRYRMFIQHCRPRAGETILDVGVATEDAGASNPLERWYPRPEDLTASGLGPPPDICRRRGIRFVRADGLRLPFADGEFDVVHANAVIEHVGNRARQRRFVDELLRVGRRVWISTPDASGPLEPHTLVPFAHWLHPRWRGRVYRALRRGYFADEANLNPLTAERFVSLFPDERRRDLTVVRQRLWGLPAVLAACSRPHR